MRKIRRRRRRSGGGGGGGGGGRKKGRKAITRATLASTGVMTFAMSRLPAATEVIAFEREFPTKVSLDVYHVSHHQLSFAAYQGLNNIQLYIIN